MRHAGLWARGLWHGLRGDFHAAVSILLPQIEQMVRLRLKNQGVHTLVIGDAGVETEKAFSALPNTEQASAFLGRNLTCDLRALLLEQVGPNLRNELAHGLATDGVLWSAPAIYSWWLCLHTALVPFALKEVQEKGCKTERGTSERDINGGRDEGPRDGLLPSPIHNS